MRTQLVWAPASLLVLLLPASAAAQQLTLNLGGTGAFGALNVTTDQTIQLPADGVIQATSVNIAAGATLRFARNARNTGVTLVSQGDVVINGTIDVGGTAGTVGAEGAGGPGGFGGGLPAVINADPVAQPRCPSWATLESNLQWPSGACGGSGSQPDVGGACTAPGSGGGGGGGALLLISHTAIRSTQMNATISARGGATSTRLPTGGPCGALPGRGFAAIAGNGGSITLVAPVMDAATLTVAVDGGAPNVSGGRVTLERIVRTADPTVSGGFVSVGNDMITFRPNPLVVNIVSVDGTALPAGSESFAFNYTPAASSTAIVVAANGCTGGTLSLDLRFLGGGSCVADPTSQYNMAPATTLTTFTCAILSSFTGYLEVQGRCTLP